MKRLLLVLLTLMIIILPCLASASQTGSAGSNALSDLEQLQLRLQDMTQIYSGGENVEVHRALDQVVLPITLYQDAAEGRVELASYELPIIEITYRYMLFIDPYNGAAALMRKIPTIIKARSSICGFPRSTTYRCSSMRFPM